MFCCIIGRVCFVWCNIIFTIIKYYIVFSVGENDNAGDGVSSGRVLRNAGAKPYLTVKLQKGQSPLDGIREVLAVLESAAGNGAPPQKESSAGLPPETDCSIPVCGI